MGYGQTTKVITYNIRYDSQNDSLDRWTERRSDLVKLVQEQKPAFMGIQEGLYHQVTYIDSCLVEYEFIGVGRDDGQKKGEFSAVFYDTSKYRILESNTFWLSKTPEEISVGWDAALERVCTYGRFENRTTNQQLWVFNTHFDHVGVKARKKSVRLILKKIRQLTANGLPVVLMGDFNLQPQEKPIRLIQRALDDGMTFSKIPLTGPIGTYNGFDPKATMERRIDYIFVKGFSVEDYQHIDARRANGRHISDHLPVMGLLRPKNIP
tara:strand:- start:1215 stop:2012 length:798 start_codon:yes stop_codon:yes gene_type:complete